MASEGDRRSDPEVERRSRLLGGLHFEGEGARGVAIALLSTAIFVTVVIVAVTQSAGWPEVKRTFFDWGDISSSFPDIAHAFKLNVEIFLVCEVFILVFALVVAVLRSLPGPVFFPLRALAIIYAGDSEEEAVSNAKEALELWFEPSPQALPVGAKVVEVALG